MSLFNKIGKFVYRVLHPKEVKSASLKETLIKGKEKIVRDNDFKKLNDYNSEFILEDDLLEEDLDDEFDDAFEDEIELENKKTKFSFRSFFAKKLSKEEKEKIIDDEEFDKLKKYKEEQENKKVETKESSEASTKKVAQTNENIYSLVAKFVENTNIDCVQTAKMFNGIDKIAYTQKEKELREFIINSKTLKNDMRYNALMEEIDRIINGNKKTINNDDKVIDFESLRNSKQEEKKVAPLTSTSEEDLEKMVNDAAEKINKEASVAKKTEESIIKVVGSDEIKSAMSQTNSNNDVKSNDKKAEIKKENHELYKKAYGEGKLSAKEYNDILTEISKQINEEIVSSKEKQETTKVEAVKPVKKEEKIVVKEVKNTISKEEADKKHEEKCKKDYNLYQERMDEIIKLNARLATLKSKLNEIGAGTMGSDYKEVLENKSKLLKEIKEIEFSIDALSNRIVVLEKRGYAREYEEKLRLEAENYTKMYENLLFEKEQEELRKKNLESNSYILNAFSDEELEKMYATDFYKDEDKLEAAMEYKKIMGM